ncbi:MAG: tetratricopeptide repeat protein [Actinomycetota bacterium]
MASETRAAPGAGPVVVHRPRLIDALNEATARRLTTLVAGAGYGKSSLIAQWSAGRDNVAVIALGPRHRSFEAIAGSVAKALNVIAPKLELRLDAGSGAPEADPAATAHAWAALCCESLADSRTDVVLVFDDLHELSGAVGSTAFVEALARQAPGSLHLVVASREELPFPIDRLRGQGHVHGLTGDDLRLSIDELDDLLDACIGPDARSLTTAMMEATGGWPAAVRLAVEAVCATQPSDRAAALDRAARREGPVFSYLATEVFDAEPEPVREMIRTLAALDRFTPRLCEALGFAGASATLSSLARRGVFVERIHGEWFGVAAAFRMFLRERAPMDASEEASIMSRAANWYESEHLFREALAARMRAGDDAGAGSLLRAHGRTLVAAGALAEVIAAASSLPSDRRTLEIEMLEGEARQTIGDWEGALTCFERAGSSDAVLPAALAWRIGLIYYFHGPLDRALEVFTRATRDGAEPRDEALLLAWQATTQRIRGEHDACALAAREALDIATACGDHQALAAAHTVLAMHTSFSGDMHAREAHDRLALDHAIAAGDLLQAVRIRANRAGHLCDLGRYREALTESDEALRLAELTGFANFRALALSNRGEALWRTGLIDEAIASLDEARLVYERLGSHAAAYPLQHLGYAYMERGDRTLSRSAFEQAIAIAEPAGDVQGLAPALSGLAKLLASEDPEHAAGLVERALETGQEYGRARALLTLVEVHRAAGRHAEAASALHDALAEARHRRDQSAIAEALMLVAELSPQTTDAVAAIEESISVWRELHSPTGEARAAITLARLLGGDAGRSLAARAHATLEASGARTWADATDAAPPVEIRTLGGFMVLRNGVPASQSDWQSRKARDLLKVLVARRGRPISREQMMELLWPDEDPERLANRLSVAQATVRSILDPAKAFEANHFVPADREAIALDPSNIAVDVYSFIDGATMGLSGRRLGSSVAASEHLMAAERLYVGDFLEEDPYEEWAVSLREEARTLYIQVARALAEDATASRDDDSAVGYRLRILERDPFDEDAHIGLVGSLRMAGRHGEARRLYQTYCARMRELGVESAPFPAGARPL